LEMKNSHIGICKMPKNNIKSFWLSLRQLFMGALLALLLPHVTMGEITYQVWTEIGGTSILNLRSLSSFPSTPDIQSTLTSFEAPTNWSDIYGARIIGYLVPPVTGDYIFWIASDNQGELWLSMDSDPDNITLIASVPGYTVPYQWDKYPEQHSFTITLHAGQVYFVEALQKEDGSSDNLSVAWEGPGIIRQVIDGIHLLPLNGTEEYSPIAVYDLFATTMNIPLKCSVLDNDKDGNLDEVCIYAFDATSTMGGTLTDNGDGSLQYTPPAGFTGYDCFSYTISDDTGRYDTADVYIAVDEVIDCDISRSEILAGVVQITTPGTPGDISIFGDQAFGLIHNGQYHPMIGAAALGKGRIILFGHGDYVDFSSAEDGYDTGTLFLNATEWATRLPGTDSRIITNRLGTQTWLEGRGYSQVVYNSAWESHLNSADLAILALDRNITSSQIQALFKFMAEGGGLITGMSGWVLISYGHYSLDEAPPNLLFRPAGLGCASGYNYSSLTSNVCTNLANAVQAINVVKDPSMYSTSQKNEAIESLNIVLEVLPTKDPIYLSLLGDMLTRSQQLYPSPSNPISDSIYKLTLRWEADYIAGLPVEQVTAHRTASIYGQIPPDAPRINRTISYYVPQEGKDTRGDDSDIWLSTGLYAVPGEIVTVSVDSLVTGFGLNLKINGDWNNIGNRDYYLRMPFGISRDYAIGEETIQAANAFGGLLYVVIPKNVVPGSFDVTFENVIEAPYFILGQQTNEEWITDIRDKPAPWAELVCDNVIITLSSDKIRSLDKAEELMMFWNDGVASQDELANLTGLRTRPSRMYSMLQTAWGSGYAGYPIGSWDWDFAKYDALMKGDCWGEFHELGHLHQSGYWTDSRTGEVTVNIFTMRAMEAVCNSVEGCGSWSRQWDPYERILMYQNTISKGGFSNGNYDEKLTMYSQLKTIFGWESFKNVYQGYRDDEDISPDKLPTNDQEEWDQWMIRFSRQCGFDLSPFFASWVYGVSQTAIDSLNDLPQWNMVETVPDSIITKMNTSITFASPIVNDFSFDGILVLISIEDPSHGDIQDNGDGTYTYIPENNFNGEDVFTYVVQNGFGNTYTGNVTIITVTLEDYLVAHWPFNGNAFDYSDSQHDGVLINGSTFTSGIIAEALDLDGYNDTVTFGNAPALNGKTYFSISAWINTTDTSSGVIIQQRNGGFNGEYMCQIKSNGQLRFMLYGNSAYQFDFTTTQAVNDGVWHHVVFIRQSNQGYIYVDGSGVASAVGSIQDLSSSIGVAIGADIRDNNSYFLGKIDDVAIWERSLDETEIQYIYQSGLQGKTFRKQHNGEKGLVDFAAFAAFWLQTNCRYCGGADLDGDGDVDITDLNYFAEHWLSEVP